MCINEQNYTYFKKYNEKYCFKDEIKISLLIHNFMLQAQFAIP